MAYRPKDTQERIIHRLKIAQGHLDGVIKMIKNGEYCIDVIHQSQAVQSALHAADSLILKEHMEKCVADFYKHGKQQVAIEEILKVYQKSRR